MNSSPVGRMIATRSPASTPRSRNPPAARRARSYSDAKGSSVSRSCASRNERPQRDRAASCRSAIRSSSGRGGRESPSSSRSTRPISPSTSSMGDEPGDGRKLALPSRAERRLLDRDADAQDHQIQQGEDQRTEERAVRERN